MPLSVWRWAFDSVTDRTMAPKKSASMAVPYMNHRSYFSIMTLMISPAR